MEIVIVLILLAILYLVPELLRRSRYFERKYEYPEIPEKMQAGKAPVQELYETYEDYDNKLYTGKEAVTMPAVVSTEINVPEQSAWQGKLDGNTILNGVIFAEILQPPRAYRPIRRYDINKKTQGK